MKNGKPELRKVLTEDEIYKLIKTHRNNNHSFDNSYLIEGENKEEKAIGVEPEANIIKSKFDSVLKTQKSEAIMISGMIGSGKSLLMRNTLLSIINTKTESFPNLDRNVFISNQSPLKTNIFNGFKESMFKMFKALLTINNPKHKRYQLNDVNLIVEGDLIFNMIYITNNYNNIKFIEYILSYEFKKHYTIISSNGSMQHDSFKEDALISGIEHNRCMIADFFLLLTSKYQKHVLKDKPLIFVIEDCHLLDALSVEFIKDFIKSAASNEIKNCFMICSFQSLICGLKSPEREKNSKLNIELEEAFTSEGTVLTMRPFTNYRNILQLIQFNVTKMLKEETEKVKDPYEDIRIDEVSPDLIPSLLPLSCKGNPLFLIEITQSLLNQNFLYLKNRTTLSLSEDFKTMLTYKDYSRLEIPSLIADALKALASSLKPSEMLVLTSASVIGTIFDIDTLLEIMTMNVTFDDLSEMLRAFESMGILEVLYDMKPKRLVCMFAIPLFRETLYAMIKDEEKSKLHARVARKMQFTKFSYMPKESENNVLQRHLEAADKYKEKKDTLANYKSKGDNNIVSEIENNIIAESNIDNTNTEQNMNGNNINIANLKILTTKEIIEKLKIIDLKISSHYSSVKKQFMPMLLSANITKKDEHGGKVEERFAVLTNTKFCYYYYDSNYYENNEPLASFYLKNIYQITILKRGDTREKKHYMEIKVSSWFKKDIPKEDRTFLIGFDTITDLYKWEISLNFLRIKNMYDEFTSNFGMIQLPLNHEFNAIEKKKIKRKLNIRSNNMKMSSIIKGKNSFIRKKTNSNINNALVVDQEKLEVDKTNLNIINENANALVSNGLALFFAKMQETLTTQKLNLIYAPRHLSTCEKLLKNARYSRFRFYTQDNYNDNEGSSGSLSSESSEKKNNL